MVGGASTPDAVETLPVTSGKRGRQERRGARFHSGITSCPALDRSGESNEAGETVVDRPNHCFDSSTGRKPSAHERTKRHTSPGAVDLAGLWSPGYRRAEARLWRGRYPS